MYKIASRFTQVYIVLPKTSGHGAILVFLEFLVCYERIVFLLPSLVRVAVHEGV